MFMRIFPIATIGLVLLAAAGLAQAVEAPTTAKQTTAIPAQSLAPALETLAQERKLYLIFASLDVTDLRTKGAAGELTPDEALKQLLSGTGLTYRFIDEQTVSIIPVRSASREKASIVPAPTREPVRLARVETPPAERVHSDSVAAGDKGAGTDSKGIPEILVKGTRSSNTDIRRTEDDVQPYVVFDAEEIGRSMAPDLETFLKTRLPMNQSRASSSQNLEGSITSNQSTIDLRGLGADQTLILVNGRRMPGVADPQDFRQPDINGIPISAVERIEILPSTAGGIYGGGATGGVVNIILKRNYSDLELTARYDGTFAGGGVERRFDATGGFTLEGGRTGVMIMASYRDSNPLYVGDRDFAARSRRLQDKNNRGAFISSSRPLHGVTTNIKSVSGRALVLIDGMLPLGTPIAHVPAGYAGPASDNGVAFLGTAGRYNLELPEDQTGNQYSLLSTPTVRSLAVSLRREFTDRVEVFVDASRYDSLALRMGGFTAAADSIVTLPVGPDNPFTEAVNLAVPLTSYDGGRLQTRSESLTEQVSGGLIVRLPQEWMVQGEYGWSRSTTHHDYPVDFLSADGNAALIDGRLNSLGDVNAYPLDFSAYYPDRSEYRGTWRQQYPAIHQNTTLRVAGPLLRLPGGPLRAATVLENQRQHTGDRVSAGYPLDGAPTYIYFAEIGATTQSVYAELTAPLISAANARRGFWGLDLQASYRRDTTRTRTREMTANNVFVPSPDGPFPDVPFQTNEVTGNQYTLGFRYMPAQHLALRVSYGEGILPPSSLQLSVLNLDPGFINFFGVIDPKRGGMPITSSTVEKFLYSSGGSLLLRPEQSQSWSAGAIITPESLPGLRISVDYTRIEKTDEIGSLNMQVLIDLEDSFPGRIARNPLTPADQALGYTGGTIRDLDAGSVNIAHSLVEALDIQADYTWETRFGAFAAHVIATVQPHLLQQAASDRDEIDSVGYRDGPLKWRANAGLRWSSGALDLGWNLQYYDASRVYTSTASNLSRDRAILSQGSAWIPTQTYHDVYGRYRFDNAPGFAHGLLENTELQISVQNVFNTRPPILASASDVPVGGYATEGDPRLRRYSIAFTKRFGH